jgi:hypothetical protein
MSISKLGSTPTPHTPTEITGRNFQAPDAPLDRIKTTDAIYTAHMQRIKAAKQKLKDDALINGPPAPQPIHTPCAPPSTDHVSQAKAIGCDLAKTTGGQTVLVGEYHDQMAQWEVLTGIVEGLRATGDTRPVIYISEIGPTDNTSRDFASWNAMPDAERQKQKGHFADQYCGVKNTAEWRSSLYGLAKIEPGMTVRMGEADGLNRLSALAPDLMAFNIDINYQVTPGGPDNYADRDSAMAIAIAALREAHPDAIIIGRIGDGHLPENLPDNPDKPDNNYLGNGLNGNDRLGEQLSLLYGRDRVHTIATVTPGRPLYNNSADQPVMTNDDGQVDYVVNIPIYDISKPWVPPADWTTP